MVRTLVVLSLLPSLALAQPAERTEQVRYLEKRIDETQGRRTLGVALTIAGGLLVGFGGTSLGIASGRATEALQLPLDSPGTKKLYLSQSTTWLGLGVGGLAAGVASVVLGLVFWLQADAASAPYQKKLDQLQLGVSVDANGATAVLSLRW